jgi:AraC family transcriptional regulator, positive regulator of tynA and feaB
LANGELQLGCPRTKLARFLLRDLSASLRRHALEGEMQAWSTLDFPSHLQFSYWREVLCEAFITLNPERKQAGAFAGTVTAHPLAGVNVTTVSSIDQRVLRGAREIRKMPLEFYFLNLQLKGECHFAQRSREALVKPNEFAIVDTTEPYELDYRGNWELYSFRIPKRMLDPLLANPNQSTATLVTKEQPLGLLAIDFLQTVARRPDAFPKEAGRSLARTMVELIGLALGTGSDAAEAARASVGQALRNSILKYIDANLSSPSLSAEKAARHFGISSRYLHKVFELGDLSFCETLLARRLDRCAYELNQRPHQPISETALTWGFNDISHFNHAFRKRFGVSPTEFRRSRMSSGYQT